MFKKMKAWQHLTSSYNAATDNPRSEKQIRAYYKNMKANSKKDIVADEVKIFRTEGRTEKQKSVKVLSLVTNSVTSLENWSDSSSDDFEGLANDPTSMDSSPTQDDKQQEQKNDNTSAPIDENVSISTPNCHVFSKRKKVEKRNEKQTRKLAAEFSQLKIKKMKMEIKQIRLKNLLIREKIKYFRNVNSKRRRNSSSSN